MQRKTIVAVYDRHEDAKDAVQALHHEGFTSDQISLVAGDSQGSHGMGAGTGHDHDHDGSHAGKGAVTGGVLGGIAGLVMGLAGMTIPGVGPVVAAGPLATALGGAAAGALAGGIIGGLIGLGIPEDDAHIYAEGIRRGSTLVGVTIPEERMDLAMSTLSRFNPIDIDERAASWRQEGWQRFDTEAEPLKASNMNHTTTTNTTTTATTPAANVTNKETAIPVMKEELQVGKREVSAGQVRVRSYVVSQPVQEQVTLREEHVNIERHPVSGTVANTADAFQEKTIVMDEKVEQAVVGKQVRQVEEVVVGKESTTHTETIKDNVRHTEVEVTRDDNERLSGYQNHYKTQFASTGKSFDEYRPAYQFGHDSSMDATHNNRPFAEIRDTLRSKWQSHSGNDTWDIHEPAIRHGYESRMGAMKR